MTRRKDPAETRTPVAAEDLPSFDTVPVKYRHDGWTPASAPLSERLPIRAASPAPRVM